MIDTERKRRVYVDVICPVYNAEETLSETLYSVIQQTVPPHLLCSSSDIEIFNIQNQYYTDGYGRYDLSNIHIDVAICCFDDASTDKSLAILEQIQRENFPSPSASKVKDDDGGKGESTNTHISTQLFIGSSTYNHEYYDSDRVHKTSIMSQGAPYARNQAIHLRSTPHSSPSSISSSHSSYNMDDYFLCFLDSDDIMHPHRIAEQISVLLYLSPLERHLTLLGCTFNRIPSDSTWHYTQWANTLADDRLVLERFREVTVIQPTWMMTRHRFLTLGGYISGLIPLDSNLEINSSLVLPLQQYYHHHPYTDHHSAAVHEPYKLIHPRHDNTQTIRLAEDLRFFHAHLFSYKDTYDNDEREDNKTSSDLTATIVSRNHPIQGGLLKLVRAKQPLLTYRHRIGQSQSSSTPRKLLLQLRIKAFEDSILRQQSKDWLSKNGFVIWGVGRDGKDFYKSLSDDIKPRVRCFVDVDEKKFGFYPCCHQKRQIPVVHFYHLIRNDSIRKQFLLNYKSQVYVDASGRQDGEDSFPGDEEHPQAMHEGVPFFGKITKRRSEEYVESKDVSQPVDVEKDIVWKAKKSKIQQTRPSKSLSLSLLSHDLLTSLPVVVCVSMYRSNGALENNVRLIERTEGVDLWHFC